MDQKTRFDSRGQKILLAEDVRVDPPVRGQDDVQSALEVIGDLRALRPATFVSDSELTVPINDVYILVPYACTIRRVTLLTIGGPGACQVDIWKDTYANFPPTDGDSITGGNEPAISGDIKFQDSTLAGWTTAVAAGDILCVHLDSNTSFTMILVNIEVEPA